jgi:eukaryotic-like serine/threonine-protein kinase
VIRREPDLVGHTLDGRYQVLDLIGAGGVGMVYRARAVKLDRTVAVKVLHEALVQNADWVRRFRREVTAMSRLHHPHCVSIVDVGMFRERPYFVMELVPGQTLIRLLRQHGPLAPGRAVGIALALLEALGYLHRHHVIHRDLKSENVMLVDGGGGDFVKVLDFGMAKILEGPGADSQISKLGSVPGTASAMAPEQIHQLIPDARIDIYATGILLYEMITGGRPFQDPDTARLVRRQLVEPPRPPREIVGADGLSLELELVILKALEKERQRRFDDAAAMAAALRETPEGRSLGPPPAPTAPDLTPYLVPESPTEVLPGPRRWLRFALAGALVAAGLAAAAVIWWPRDAPAPRAPHDVARRAASPSPSPSTSTSPTPPARPPAPVAEPWLAHRDLAVTYQARGKRDDAYREVLAAIGDAAAAARADPVLAEVAAAVIQGDRVAYVVETFRENPRLAAALAQATARGATADQRHAALQGLRALGQEARADLVAMRLLDVEQATACPAMRAAFAKLRRSGDPRVRSFIVSLRARGADDRHVRCLRREL